MVEEELELLVDELVDRMTVVSLIVVGIWLAGTVIIAFIRDRSKTKRIQIREEAETERLRIEQTAATDQTRIRSTNASAKKKKEVS